MPEIITKLAVAALVAVARLVQAAAQHAVAVAVAVVAAVEVAVAVAANAGDAAQRAVITEHLAAAISLSSVCPR